MYNSKNIGRTALVIIMDDGYGLNQVSWKIPGVPFDPKHGHLFWEVCIERTCGRKKKR
jgi:hypothetical protein